MRRVRLPHIDPYGLIVALLGLLVIAEVFVRNLPERLENLTSFIPENTARLTVFIIGLALLYLAEQITRRKLNAWRVVITLLTILVIFSIRRAAIVHTLLFAAVICLLVFEQRKFVVRSDLTSLRRGIYTALTQVVIAIVIVGAIFAVIDQREFGRNITTVETFRYTVGILVGDPQPKSIPTTHYDRLLISGLRLTGLFSLVIIGTSLFRPLRLLGKTAPTTRALAESILRRYGNDPEDYFKLFPEDKHYYFYGDSFVAYAVRGSTAVVLDNAIGKKRDVVLLRSAFAEYCRVNGWQAVILHADTAEAAAWATIGFEKLQIGSEAVIDSRVFAAETITNKHFRYVRNRAERDNLSVEFLKPPLSALQVEQLEQISNTWIENGRQEYGFIMAPFSHAYLQECSVGVLLSAGEPMAYINFLPKYKSTTASIDHMRFTPDASSVAMHFLLMQATLHALEEGSDHFNLGFVPLAKLDTTENRLSSRLMALIRRLGSRFYSSNGLEQFKGKFEPTWAPRYISYTGGVRQLPVAVNTLRKIISHTPKRGNRPPRWPVLVMTLSALLYMSFPLAFRLNPTYALNGLTSALGGTGQPYAWLFNFSDIISSVTATLVLVWIQITRPPKNTVFYIALRLALISSVAACIAALVPLPGNSYALQGDVTFISALHQPIILIHLLASIVSEVSFVLAASCWAWYERRMRGFGWRMLLAIAVVTTEAASLGLAVMLPTVSDISQRLGIIIYGVWFIAFTIDLLRPEKTRKTH